jgi:hypothetical protein
MTARRGNRGRDAGSRHKWIPKEIRALKRMYPHIRNKDIGLILGRSKCAVHGMANKLGLEKSLAFIHSPLGNGFAGHRPEIVAHRFPKGHVPANKGLRRPGYAPGRMRETQFKKGHFPANRDPDFYVIGALRVNADGYIDMRVSFEPGAIGWRGLHLILWEDAHGRVPKGHCLRFKDGDRLNVCLENLELIHRAQNMRRNSIHNLPTPLKNTIQLLGQLKRRIREKQDRRFA